MKKIALSAAAVALFFVYALYQKGLFADMLSNVNNDKEPVIIPSSDVSGPGNTPSDNMATATATPLPSPTSTPVPTGKSTGLYRDGSYLGNVADAIYGPLQVKAVVSGGKLTDVQFLKYPNDRPTSTKINEGAIPTLKQEAIKAQGSNVDIVSGATQSSEAFNESLTNALAQAAN